jgi:hypothetical protein
MSGAKLVKVHMSNPDRIIDCAQIQWEEYLRLQAAVDAARAERRKHEGYEAGVVCTCGLCTTLRALDGGHHSLDVTGIVIPVSLENPDIPCPTCGGSGLSETIESPNITTLSPCIHCGGTGRKG